MTTPAEPRRYRRYITGGIFVAVALVATAVTVSLLPTHPATKTGVAAPTSSAPAASGGSETSASPDPTASPSSPPAERGETPTQPDAATGQPREVATAPPRLVNPPPQQSESEVGKLVAGFPDAVPLAPKSTISTSSLDSDGTRVQASLEASTPESAADVTTYYEKLFAALGFPGTPSPAASGSTAVLFARGGESVTLTVTPSATGSRYSLFGVLGAGA